MFRKTPPIPAGSERIFGADADIGREDGIERIADFITGRHVLGNTEPLAGGAVAQQSRGFAGGEPEPAQGRIVRRIGIEGEERCRIRPALQIPLQGGCFLRPRPGLKQQAEQREKPRQRQESQQSQPFAHGKPTFHLTMRPLRTTTTRGNVPRGRAAFRPIRIPSSGNRPCGSSPDANTPRWGNGTDGPPPRAACCGRRS